MFATLIHLSRVGSYLNTLFNTTLSRLRPPVDEQDISTFREGARTRTHARTYAQIQMNKYNIIGTFYFFPPTFCHSLNLIRHEIKTVEITFYIRVSLYL